MPIQPEEHLAHLPEHHLKAVIANPSTQPAFREAAEKLLAEKQAEPKPVEAGPLVASVTTETIFADPAPAPAVFEHVDALQPEPEPEPAE